ncbi:hypothetical protein O3P69_020017 [Scylla paramamosain]|uniref:Uncharacterized protein n=1 Tax=Scylla paramamosain TaxID=85552 RepID=A0AAW0TJC0_SCYPA
MSTEHAQGSPPSSRQSPSQAVFLRPRQPFQEYASHVCSPALLPIQRDGMLSFFPCIERYVSFYGIRREAARCKQGVSIPCTSWLHVAYLVLLSGMCQQRTVILAKPIVSRNQRRAIAPKRRRYLSSLSASQPELRTKHKMNRHVHTTDSQHPCLAESITDLRPDTAAP